MTNKSQAFFSLLIAAVVFSILPNVPYGNSIQWPFEMLTTYVHELGHGLAAIAQGGRFLELQMFQNGGGLASVSHLHPGWGIAFVSAVGLLSPSIVGGLFILGGRSRNVARLILVSFALLMLLSCLLWIRSTFGLVLIGGMGCLFLLLGMRTGGGLNQFLVHFFAVHMLMDTLTRTMRYLFTGQVDIGGQIRHSDTANIANSLGGSYWMWGSAIAFVALMIFYLSFRYAYLQRRL